MYFLCIYMYIVFISDVLHNTKSDLKTWSQIILSTKDFNVPIRNLKIEHTSTLFECVLACWFFFSEIAKMPCDSVTPKPSAELYYYAGQIKRLNMTLAL